MTLMFVCTDAGVLIPLRLCDEAYMARNRAHAMRVFLVTRTAYGRLPRSTQQLPLCVCRLANNGSIPF